MQIINAELSDSDLEQISAGLGKRQAPAAAAPTQKRTAASSYTMVRSMGSGYSAPRQAPRPMQAPRMGSCANGQC